MLILFEEKFYIMLNSLKNLIKEKDPHASIDDKDNKPLHQAAREGNFRQVEKLLKKNVDVNAVNKYGMTPLHEAARYGHTEIVRVLLAKGADIKKADELGDTALHWAVKCGKVFVVQILIEHKADVEAVNKLGDTPVHCAASRGADDMVRLFFAHSQVKFNVNRQNKAGNSLLHLAVDSGNANLVSVLVAQSSIKMDLKNEKGKTPLLLARTEDVKLYIEQASARLSSGSRSISTHSSDQESDSSPSMESHVSRESAPISISPNSVLTLQKEILGKSAQMVQEIIDNIFERLPENEKSAHTFTSFFKKNGEEVKAHLKQKLQEFFKEADKSTPDYGYLIEDILREAQGKVSLPEVKGNKKLTDGNQLTPSFRRFALASTSSCPDLSKIISKDLAKALSSKKLVKK